MSSFDRSRDMEALQWHRMGVEFLKEPVTESRYTRTGVGYIKIPPLEKLFHAANYKPIEFWREFDQKDARWDSVFIDRFGVEYANNSAVNPDGPVPIYAQMMQMGKSYMRKIRKSRVGLQGVIAWAEWPRIPHCWFIVDDRDRHWLRSEEEMGFQHEGSK